MCGIAGIVNYRQASPIERAELLAIRDAMANRGPDGAGLWLSTDGQVGLGHRRLAIIDLSETGAQPMATQDGRFRIIFNGEIYNYRGLRKDLTDKGHRFVSASDTEVLLHLYQEHGRDMLPMLRGMFAFAIWDDREKSLLLARDSFGIKPLYFEDNGRTVRFASQVKALIKGGHVNTAPSPAGHTGFFTWGHVPDPFTLYRSIRALPAGTSALVTSDGFKPPVPYFCVADEFKAADELMAREPGRDATAEIQAAIKASVLHHLIADVPVGVFLSAGLDSTTLAALAAELDGAGRLRTLTLGFDEYRGTVNDETPLAQLAAEKLGTSHETRWISRNDFEDELSAVIDAMDQPTIDGVNTYFVSKAAAESGMKVALSGIGGDELFGGYPSFKEIPRLVRAVRPFTAARLGGSLRRISSPLLRWITSPKSAGVFEYGADFAGAYLLRRGLFMPWELAHVMDPVFAAEGWSELETLTCLRGTYQDVRSPTHRVSALELSWYMRNQLLRDADWAGMAHSVEIRVPFVDVDLFRALAPFMAGGKLTKEIVAKAPRFALPPELLKRRKTGFSIPVREWLAKSEGKGPYRRGLRGWARFVNPQPSAPKRILALATEAFGGHGGIAKFNRDLLTSLATSPQCKEVTLVSRLMPREPDPLPPKLRQVADSVKNKPWFVLSALREVLFRGPIGAIVCCHIHLLPIAYLASVIRRAPLILIIHGIDAWQPTRSWLANLLTGRIQTLVSVSDLTRRRFEKWSGTPKYRSFILPNCVDLEVFKPRPKNHRLVTEFGLEDRIVLMTMGRLVSAERYKGFDEVLNLLVSLRKDLPDLAYMIVGEGNDRARLEKVTRDLGLSRHVIFTGFIAEKDKCDVYNLADVFVMPSRGEGFGIVFLEAMACGVPVIGSEVDGSREALLNGELGALVDPDDPAGIKAAIMGALIRPKAVPGKLEHFSFPNFQRRVHHIISASSA